MHSHKLWKVIKDYGDTEVYGSPMILNEKGNEATNMGFDFNYIMSACKNLEPGKWIAIVDQDMVTGDSAKEVLAKIRTRHPGKEPFVMQVPERAVMLF